MAKDLTAVELAAALTAMGLDVPDELAAKIENEVEDNAFHKIVPLLSVPEDETTDKATEWQERLFTLSDDFESDFTGERANIGQGNKFRRQVVIQTNNGTLTVKLIQD
jgi:hypothetical protein